MDYSLKNDVDGRDSFYVPRYEVKEIFFVIKQIGFVGLLSELIIYVCRYRFPLSQTDSTSTWSGESPLSLLGGFSFALAFAFASGVILIT